MGFVQKARDIAEIPKQVQTGIAISAAALAIALIALAVAIGGLRNGH